MSPTMSNAAEWPDSATPPTTLDVRVETSAPDELTVTACGELDFATAGLLTAVLGNHPGARIIRLDLAALTFVDCAGLRALAEVRERVTQGSGRLVIMHAQPRVRWLSQLTGRDNLLAGGRASAADEPHEGGSCTSRPS